MTHGEFIVTLMDDERNIKLTRCKTNQELAQLLMDLDEAYMVASVVVMEPLSEDYTQFIKKQPELEKGELV